ncbi:trypsin-like peptidase domain-containing protein [Candidatus Uhrbacteria bacterium]|nr:trypsin-like peptidase domain-containing protein [Candidatus Uhrbacteria bacterium]
MPLKSPSTIIAVWIALTAAVAALAGAAGGFVAAGVLPSTFSTLSGFSGSRAPSDDSRIIELLEEETATIGVVERVTPAVVSIVAKKRVADLEPWPEDSLEEFLFFPEPSDETFPPDDPDRLVEVAGGTGFFVSEDGLVATNKHVVADPDATYTVVTNDGRELPAIVLDLDPFFDVAILKVETVAPVPYVVLGDAEQVRIGQTVIAIGNTLSQYRNTVTKGVVSGLDRSVSAYDEDAGSELIEDAIQTDAAINFGNSGGPLINLRGQVIGMNTAISAEGEGIGFAIPIREVVHAVDSVREHGRIVRPWLGVRFVMLTSERAVFHSLPVSEGAWIPPGEPGAASVVPGSPADAADLRPNDVVTHLNGQVLSETYSLARAVRAFAPGDAVTLTVLRDGETFDVEVMLDEFMDASL